MNAPVPGSRRNSRPFDESERLLVRALETIPLGTQTFSKSHQQYVRGAMPQFAASVSVRRQVMYWFACEPAHVKAYRSDGFPIFIWHWGEGAEDVFYGFPEIGAAGAIKVATEQHAFSTTPQTVNREVTVDEIAAMHARHIASRLRGIGKHGVKALTCLYTNAPRANFVIDFLPDAKDIIVVSACSGHGFKHSAAIGEAVATMAVSGETPDVLKPFSLSA